jgi:uncharacterized membrane protein YhhN
LPFAAVHDRKSPALAVLCAAACVVLVAALLLDRQVIAALAKLVASSAFVATAVSNGALASRYGSIVLAGLLLSWCGDAFLIGTTRPWFLLGLSSFLLAHIAYVTAFLGLGIARRWTLGAALPVLAIALGVLSWLQAFVPAELIWPVRCYTAVISLMLVTAFGTLGAGATPLIAAGASLFFLSDLSVAAMRFTQPSVPTYALGLPLYYAAQICLAFSITAGSNPGPSTALRRKSPPGSR